MALSKVTYKKLFRDFLVTGSHMVGKDSTKDFTFIDILVTIRSNKTSTTTDETPTLLLDR